MKKLITIFACGFLTSQVASAQLSVAPEVGFQMTKVNLKPSQSVDFKPNFRLGLNVSSAISNNLQVQFGAFYSGKGAKQTLLGTTVQMDLSYIEIPVYINYMTGEDGGNRFFVGAGPYLGYCIGGKWKAGGTETKLEIGSDETKDDIKPLDLGININAGYLLSNNFYIRGQYGIGLANNIPGGDANNSQKNTGFAISLGYNFGL